MPAVILNYKLISDALLGILPIKSEHSYSLNYDGASMPNSPKSLHIQMDDMDEECCPAISMKTATSNTRRLFDNTSSTMTSNSQSTLSTSNLMFTATSRVGTIDITGSGCISTNIFSLTIADNNNISPTRLRPVTRGSLAAWLYYSGTLTQLQSVDTKVGHISRQLEQTPEIGASISTEAVLPQIESYVKNETELLWEELEILKKKVQILETNGCGVCRHSNIQPDLRHPQTEDLNYAMLAIGATIVHVEDRPYYKRGYLQRLIDFWRETNSPQNILDPSMDLDNCYAFQGDTASFLIRLSHEIRVQGVTVEHVPSSVSEDISNAPKVFFVYGLKDWNDKEGELLGTFRYNNLLMQRAQTFNLRNNKKFQYCKLEIKSNYGNPFHTCIYRIAIHGLYK